MHLVASFITRPLGDILWLERRVQVCQSCSKGFYAEVTGSEACLACPPGNVAPELGSSGCTPCAKGFYQSASGQRYEAYGRVFVFKLEFCLRTRTGTVGRFLSLPFSSRTTFIHDFNVCSACVECDVGNFAANPGLSACSNCEAGTYQPARGAEGCIDCSAGYFQPTPGQRLAEICGLMYTMSVACFRACFCIRVGGS